MKCVYRILTELYSSPLKSMQRNSLALRSNIDTKLPASVLTGKIAVREEGSNMLASVKKMSKQKGIDIG